MHLFDQNEQLKLYKTAEEIIEAYYDVRYRTYVERKDYLIKKHETELVTLSNKAKYITEVLNGTIDLRRKKKDAIRSMLTEKQYAIIDEDEDYKYLVKMPMDSVSEENVEKLLKEKGDKEFELTVLKATSIEKMWLSELEELSTLYKDYQKQRAAAMMELVVKKTIKKKKLVKK
jgi:DNA topoisomerase-2